MLPALAIVLLGIAGCGSKISEANYYRVQYGMNEAAVEDLLGPPHREGGEPGPETKPAAGSATAPAADPGSGRTVKTWTRGALIISIVFENGKVVGRRSEGDVFRG